jgi:hypothetical protein
MIGWMPPDNKELAEKYAKIGGVCGPATIAAYKGLFVKEVLDQWRGLGEQSFKGYSPIKELKETLTTFKLSFDYFKAGKAKAFPTPRTTSILRIQWLKEDGTEYYWRAAGAHTHYVLMEKGSEGWWIYCNGTGWFLKDSLIAENYLTGRGYVSSWLELSAFA